MRLGIRLLLGVFLIAGLSAWFVLSIFSKEVKPGVRQGMEVALVDTANLLAEFAAEDLAAGRIERGRLAEAVARYRTRQVRASIWGLTKARMDFQVYVTDGAGIVRYDSEGAAVGRDYSRWTDVGRTLQGAYGARATRMDPADPRTSAMYVGAPVLRDGRVLGVLTVISPTASVQPYARRSEHRIRSAGLVLLGASLFIGAVLTWWLTRDVARLRSYARTAGSGGRTPLPALGSPELRELGEALESMRTRLDGRAYVERYVHTLTHEMKSPLSAIRGAAELLREPLPEADRARFADNVLEQARRMRALVDRMLALAELQHRQGLHNPAQVDLRDLAERAAAARRPQAEARGLGLRVVGEGAAPVRGEAFLLEQAVGNLVDNALSFAPAGSQVVLAVERRPGSVRITVRDAGPGLPDFALDKVFTPFFSLARPDGATRGTGLGLCFVREIAELHGGSAALVNAPGGGALATLALPATSAPGTAGD
ncbi:two-component system sensor histidine kinase CreC [Mesoterricola sediminis]|uniref:histidine kinase n=1 Tax=Mesoterricola sediminis TaxID=2927980 RepID=A0AA48GY21_9BACT|nr:two-component system sensor histidine kinase CreC [Mesoterricola sediminis]BDU78389.1 two-component sensor histidine kinase [Mesoterricola sediminis]